MKNIKYLITLMILFTGTASAKLNTTEINATVSKATNTLELISGTVGETVELGIITAIVIVICAVIGVGFKAFRILFY